MQVRHIENVQLDLAKAEKAELLNPAPALQDDKPWEEVLECLAVLAAIHMNPCQSARERNTDENKRQAEKEDDDDNTDKV